MPEYKVRLNVEVDYFTTVEADDEEHAKELAHDEAEFDVMGGDIYSIDFLEIEELE